MKYIKVTRKDTICNICQNNNTLSWDHVPPQGGIDLSSLEVRNYNNTNFHPNSPNRDILQNGLKYRTLCKKCNSLLGSSYDTTFNQLMRDAFIFAQSELYLPQTILIKTFPTKVIKSLLGHLLASKTDYCKTKIDVITRNYLSDKNTILPTKIHIYCWFYPYNCTIVCSDKYQLNSFTGQSYYYSIIKTFPLAFAISLDNQLNELLINSTEITKYNHNNEDELATIPIRLINNMHWDYPEDLKYSGAQLVSSVSNDIFAIQKK